MRRRRRSRMEFHVITLFPEMFAALESGLVGRAQKQGLITIRAHNLRDYGLGNYRQVDDTPYGGGSGMVLKPEPIFEAVEAIKSNLNLDLVMTWLRR
jgi:tRNA (guanine-N1)-methyltransferase